MTDLYRKRREIDRVHQMVGADVPRDAIRTIFRDQEENVVVELAPTGTHPVRVENTSDVYIDPATEPTLATIAAAVNANSIMEVEQQTPVGVEDTTGTQVDPLTPGDQPFSVTPTDTDEAFANAATLTASSSLTVASLTLSGAERLVGQVVSTGTYDLVFEWRDSAGNLIRSETYSSGVAGGTWTSINVDARSPYVDVVVTDTSGADQTVDATLHGA